MQFKVLLVPCNFDIGSLRVAKLSIDHNLIGSSFIIYLIQLAETSKGSSGKSFFRCLVINDLLNLTLKHQGSPGKSCASCTVHANVLMFTNYVKNVNMMHDGLNQVYARVPVTKLNTFGKTDKHAF